MHRRSLLPDLLSRAAANAAAPGFSRVRPGDPAWPSAESWAKLKEAVGSNLIAVEPPFGACAADPQGAACADALASIHNPFYIGDQPGGTQVSGWLDAWTPAPSAYAVKARSSADVAAAVNFARDNRLRLVVKGAGHSYQGTSDAPDSLLIWTRAMNQVTVHDSFTPQGCEGKIAPSPAVTAEAGAVWIDLYHAVTSEAGRYVQGGGGSWGVMTRLTMWTHDLPAFFGAAWGTIQARSDEAFRRLVAFYSEEPFQSALGRNGQLRAGQCLQCRHGLPRSRQGPGGSGVAAFF